MQMMIKKQEGIASWLFLLWARHVMGYEEEGLSMGDEKMWHPWDMVKG